MDLTLNFLFKRSHTDVNILKDIKAATEGRSNVLHNATVVAHAYMNAGKKPYFLSFANLRNLIICIHFLIHPSIFPLFLSLVVKSFFCFTFKLFPEWLSGVFYSYIGWSQWRTPYDFQPPSCFNVSNLLIIHRTTLSATSAPELIRNFILPYFHSSQNFVRHHTR